MRPQVKGPEGSGCTTGPLHSAAMRRYVLILIMLILPLQWSGAVVASICGYEAPGAQAHLGHHDHAHEASDQHASAETADADPAQPHDADCGTCHGQVSLALSGVAAMPLPDGDTPSPGALVRHLPDPAPDNLLRPPLSHLV